MVIPIVNRSTVHFRTYSPGKKWSYQSSTDQQSISYSHISLVMVASSVSTNQRSILTHIVLLKSSHTYCQQINDQFYIVISLSGYGCMLIVNESTVYFHTYSPGKKWSYPPSTDQRSIFAHIVPEKSGHTHRQQINGQFHVVIALTLWLHHQYHRINGPFLHI